LNSGGKLSGNAAESVGPVTMYSSVSPIREFLPLPAHFLSLKRRLNEICKLSLTFFPSLIGVVSANIFNKGKLKMCFARFYQHFSIYFERLL
jgi:hypothetical protein